MDLLQLFIYCITVNKYRFCISVIGYINMQIIDIGYKKSISVDHYFRPLSNSPVLFLLSPGKMLLTMFLFQKWLGSPFPEDV